MAWEESSRTAPPPSRRRTFLPLRADSTASVMPAAPAPTMQMSARKPEGGVSLRRSYITRRSRATRESWVRGGVGGLASGQDGLDAFEYESDLFVVVVAVANGAKVSSGGDTLAGCFVGQVAANFFG